MSLHNIAAAMQSHGRGPDDTLVHMSSREVAGLQGLANAAGGSLTVNPTTGLPEAGFLDSLLPTILGAGATLFGGPMAGAAVGALTGAAQNKDNPLMGAITGGLGGYGAGQFVGGLGSLASPTTAALTPMEALASGAQNAMSDPSALLRTLGDAKGAMQAGLMAATPMLTAAPESTDTSTGPTSIPKYRVSRQYTGGVAPEGSPYTSERSWFSGPTFERVYADGGAVMGMQSGGFVIPADVVSALGNGSSSAGLEILAQQLGAVPIGGEGDGQSDSIPATVDGEYPAAVAREEAYLSPEAVERFGGAERLYQLMDQIRMQAHGSPDQQRAVT